MMKKLSLLLCFIAVVFVGSAQSTGKLGVEVQLLNPFQNKNFFSGNSLNLRCFLNENVALRGKLNIMSGSYKSEHYNNVNQVFGTYKEDSTTFTFTPGIEFHVAKFQKGSVYVGGQVGFGFGSKNATIEYVIPTTGQPNTSSENPVSTFTVGVFSGVDYYLTTNLYLGAELGLNYLSYSIDRGSETTGTQTTEGSTAMSGSLIGVNVNPALRLGWRF